jgi:hypothetical protein
MAEPVAPSRPDGGAARRQHRASRSGGRAGQRARASARARLTAEHLWVLLLGLGVLAVHDVGYMLSQPFWNDEAWVALTTRFPLSQLPQTTSSTPIGWSLLLRLVSGSASETGRLLPLVFAGLAVAAGYWLGRGLGWPDRFSAILGGTLAAVGVLLGPAMLLRDDLKQYTADACLTLLLLGLVSRLERDWSRRNLGLLALVAGAGILLSDAEVFVTVAAFAALAVVQLARREWRRLAEVVVAGVAAAVVLGGLYKAFVASAAGALGASAHWDGFYVPAGQGLHASLAWIVKMLGLLRADFGLGPAVVAIPLVLAGLVTMFVLGRPATALVAAALLPEMAVLSALKVYPFGDLRTSTFLIVAIMTVAAIGVAGLAAGARRLLSGTAAALIPSAVAAAAVAGLLVTAAPDVRSHSIPAEDVRDQASYIAAHARPGDVILVNMNSSWGFAYYWPHGQPARRATTVVRQGYLAYFPDQPQIVVAPNRDLAGVRAGLSGALTRVRAGSCATIWLVRSHVIPSEQAAWTAALKAVRLTPEPVGTAGLAELHPGGSACR